MSADNLASRVHLDIGPGINRLNFVWSALAIMSVGLIAKFGNVWALNFFHVMSGALWTGFDLFLGFVLGPIMGTLSPEARRNLILRLVPRTMFVMPTLAIMTGLAGYLLAGRLGFLQLPWPEKGWIIAAEAIVAALTIQGFGFLLPSEVRIYFELRKPQPDTERIGRIMSKFFYLAAVQGCLQVCIIIVMAKLVTGF